jgi:D-arabinose 1-dehydrogenase-like Zn-dependent alcohol dehydrogenase
MSGRRLAPANATARHGAVEFDGARLELTTRATPRPGDGEVLLAPLVAGLCGTDLQILRGIRREPARVLGHEGVATVVATGRGVPAHLAAGTRVTVNPTHPNDDAFLLGHNVDGFLQERLLIPATAVRAGLVIEVPDELDDGLAPLLEPLAVVRYALTELAPFEPDRLLVVGDGTIGHLAVRAAARWLGPEVSTCLAHHTRDGLEFSRGAPRAADTLMPAAELDPLPPGARTVVIMATPRPGTLAALDRVLGTQPDLVAVDVIGGLPPDGRSAALPGVDLPALRAANRGGVPRPARTAGVTTANGRRLHVFGHRGVANRHLAESAAELVLAPDRYRDLITHEVDLPGALPVLSALSGSPGRVIDGRRLIKLAVRIGTGSGGTGETGGRP